MTTKTEKDEKTGTKAAQAGGLKPAEIVRNCHALTVPAETTREDLERPSFWMHEAAKMRAFDRIEVRWADGLKWADVLVLSTGAGFARIHVLSMMDLSGGDASADEEGDDFASCYVKYRGPSVRWSVMRKSDNLVVKEGLASRTDALIEARQYDKTVSG